MSHATISPWATLLLASVFCGQPFMQPHQDGAKESSEQPNKNTSTEAASASATDTDYQLIEIVALDLLRNKEFVKNFGPVPKGQKIPRRLWISSTTLPFLKIILEGTNADYTYFRDQRGPQDAFDIPDEIHDNLVQHNQIPVSIANFKPKSHSVMIGSPVKQGTVITNLGFKYAYLNTGSLASWLPGFSKDGRQALLRFVAGPTAHGMDGAYMFTKREDGWRIKWRYVRYR